MRTLSLAAAYGVVGLCLVWFTGCGKGKTNATSADGETADSHSHSHSHDHAPHGGLVIELDTPRYHAEITEDEASHRVGVYMLGSHATAAVPIEATSVTIEVSSDGQTTTYTLPAVPQPGEEPGQSSYFELKNEVLHKLVTGKSQSRLTTLTLIVTMYGQSITGTIPIESSPLESSDGQAGSPGHSSSDNDA
jgi:hypothetical protein